MESGKQTWEDLLRLMQEFYRSNPTATLNDARVRVAAEPIIKRNELTFGDARRIDEVLFLEQKNTHWAEAFKFPDENGIVFVSGENRSATNVGVFTFTPSNIE